MRLLVREPARIQQALEPLGIGEVDYTVGDVTDAASVEKGMTGCDAAVHAASVYSLDARAGKLMGRVNVEGTKIVLSAAARLELDPVVYVSSLGVFYPPDGAILDEQSPVKEPPGPYYGSKAERSRSRAATRSVASLSSRRTRAGCSDRTTLTSARAPASSPAS